MKKLIATILVLAMVLTMALTVSAAPGATLSSLMEGEYEILDPMAPPNMHVVIYTLSFQKNSLAGGTLTIEDNNFSGIGGTYTYTVDSNDVATISVEAGNTGDANAAAAMNFSYDMGGNLIFALGVMQQYTCISLDNSAPQGPTGTELTLGANAIDVTVENQYCAGTETYFTAPEAGTYVFATAADEANAEIGYYGDPDDWSDDVGNIFEEGSYEFELEEGETITLWVYTTEYMTLTEDTIDFTITKKGAQDGGNAGGGSANTGDGVALYVALGSVALASIFGCAIVSKKRIAE